MRGPKRKKLRNFYLNKYGRNSIKLGKRNQVKQRQGSSIQEGKQRSMNAVKEVMQPGVHDWNIVAGVINRTHVMHKKLN